ncbi:MAG: hypothetical protein M3133_05555, partial [Actinomycetota bacterium]|nr:hypothetical protein [Actinomycetota bacterium]
PGGREMTGTAAKLPGGREMTGTAAKPPGGREMTGTAAEPLRERAASWSSSLPMPPEPKPAQGMRPGLLTELLGEEPKEAETEAEPIPPVLGGDGVPQRAEAEWRQETASGREPRQAGATQSATPALVERNTAGFACPSCDFIAKSAAGLSSHRRRHA